MCLCDVTTVWMNMIYFCIYVSLEEGRRRHGESWPWFHSATQHEEVLRQDWFPASDCAKSLRGLPLWFSSEGKIRKTFDHFKKPPNHWYTCSYMQFICLHKGVKTIWHQIVYTYLQRLFCYRPQSNIGPDDIGLTLVAGVVSCTRVCLWLTLKCVFATWRVHEQCGEGQFCEMHEWEWMEWNIPPSVSIIPPSSPLSYPTRFFVLASTVVPLQHCSSPRVYC